MDETTVHSQDWINPDQWTPPNGWDFLDALAPHLRPAGKLMAYLVSRVDAGGPDWTLSFPDVDDAGTIQDVLEHAGLIELYDTPSGIRRWRRTPEAVSSSANARSNECDFGNVKDTS